MRRQEVVAVQEVGCLRAECREARGLPGSQGRERARGTHCRSARWAGPSHYMARAPVRAQSWRKGPPGGAALSQRQGEVVDD